MKSLYSCCMITASGWHYNAVWDVLIMISEYTARHHSELNMLNKQPCSIDKPQPLIKTSCKTGEDACCVIWSLWLHIENKVQSEGAVYQTTQKASMLLLFGRRPHVCVLTLSETWRCALGFCCFYMTLDRRGIVWRCSLKQERFRFNFSPLNSLKPSFHMRPMRCNVCPVITWLTLL